MSAYVSELLRCLASSNCESFNMVDKHRELSVWWWVDLFDCNWVRVGETFTCGCAVQKQRVEAGCRDMI
jgi:hypothetical protein